MKNNYLSDEIKMQDETKQQQSSQQNIKILPKKESHQIKALFYKTSTLQWKQPCTNICQIITPIICLIFTGMIRQVAIENLPTDENNIYNQVPMVPFKLNDFEIQYLLENQAFQFNCNRWLLYDWKNDTDVSFIGTNDGIHKSSGFLKNVLRTNPIDSICFVNQSFYYPYSSKIRNSTPYFRNPHNTINQDLFQRYLYFNNMTLDDVWHTTAVQKMPDGAVFFSEANKQRLSFDLKVNDLRSFQLHPKTGITKISIRRPFTPNASWQTYYTIPEGLLQLMDMVSHAYIKQLTGQHIIAGYIYMPMTSISSAFIEALINTISTIIFPLSLSLLLPVFLYNLVLEKQTKIIQMMRMNGLSIATYWFTNFFFNFIISIVTFGVFYGFGIWYIQSAFFIHTSPLVIGTLLFGWILCQIGMSMIFQVFLSNSRAANIIGYLITIWTNLIGATLSVALYQFPVQMPIWITLWPTIAFNRVFYLMFINCSADHCYGSLSQLSQQAYRCLIIIYGMGIIFMLLGMYLYEIIPQQFGVSKSIFFPFQCLFRRKKTRQNRDSVENFKRSQDHQLKHLCDEYALAQIYKVQDEKFLDRALICDRLTKVYDNGKRATSDFSLILEDNQVFGLLGPNGAGKTTLISMITGIFSPSSGTAYVAGYNIESEIDQVHMNMGVCPQFDILWDQLTVEEHLYFYARLRGISGKDEKSKVIQTLGEVALQKFAKFKVKQLSGGMKRRLSVAISLVGDPRIVFLDEPTSGLDPENRRNLWELLSKCKTKRSLFLTTHLMEEAQSLCDRIGIITNGRLRTVGDQMDLKKRYGNGYVLTVSIQMLRQENSSLYSRQYNALNDSQNQFENSEQYQDDSSIVDDKLTPKKRISIMSSNMSFDQNYMHSESLALSNNRFGTNSRKQSLGMRKQSSEEEEQNFVYKSSKAKAQQKLTYLKTLIMDTLSANDFLNSQIFQQSSAVESNQQHISYPYIEKELNGTLQFVLGKNIKISKVLESLSNIKNGKINLDAPSDQEQSQQQAIDFQWSINNSRLQDVFLNIVKKYTKQQGKKQALIIKKLVSGSQIDNQIQE